MTVGVDDEELTLLTWRQNDPFKKQFVWRVSLEKSRNFAP